MNPYAPPQASPSTAPGHADYSPASFLGLFAVGLIAAELATRWAMLVVDWSWMASFQQGLRPTEIVTTERVIRIVGGFASLAAVVVFFVWLYRAARNVRALGRVGLEYSPGMCLGCWFIPIANLFMPYQAVSQIAVASDPEGRGTSPFYVLAWWLIYVGSGIVGLVRVFVTLGQVASPADLPARLALNAIANAVSTVCLVALLFTVRFIDRGQAYWASQPRADQGASLMSST